MSCTSPIEIRSNSKRYRPLVSRYTLYVPCCHCPDCLQRQQEDWFLRIWQEIDQTNRTGGKVVFFTPTYNNRYLPTFKDKAPTVDCETGEIYEKEYVIPCFSKKHKDIFENSLRKFFERRGLTGNTCGKKIRFFWASEYGMSEGSTHRPHYHVLCFLPKEYIDNYGILQTDFTSQKLKDLFQDYWHYGFIRWSKPKDGGMFVTSEFAGTYVSKYVVKDINFFGQPELDEYLSFPDFYEAKRRYEKVKSHFPRHWQSKSFGIGLTELCDRDEVFKDGLNFTFKKDVRLGRKKIYHVPKYIERKLLYEIDSFGCQVLNDRGKKVKNEQFDFDKCLERMYIHNSDYIKLDYLQSRVANDISSFNTRYGHKFSSVQQLQETLKSYVQGKDLRELCLYQMVFKGTILRSLPEYGKMTLAERNNTTFAKSFNSYTYEELYEDAKFLYNQRIEGYSNEDFYDENGFLSHFRTKNLVILDDFERFSGFDRFLLLSLQVNNHFRLCKYEKYLKDRTELQKTKMNSA